MSQLQENQMNEWMPEVQAQPENIQQMDGLIKKLSEARRVYEVAKKESAKVYHQLEETQKEVINALKVNGRTKFECEGVALVQIRSKDVFETPKSHEQKKGLFDYIFKKYGEETLTNMLSINHQTLNSWANSEIENDPGLTLPGLNQPTSVETLYFTKKD